jgi:hypothetical protein
MRKLLLATAIAILSVSSAKAQSVYTVTMNTAPLAGQGAFKLDLQLLDGSGQLSDLNNKVTLTNFNFGTGGAPLGNGVPTNDAHGNLATSVTLQDSAFFNEYVESFAAGSSLSFTVTITNAADAGGTPDLFTFAILDSNGNELPTSGFANEFLSMSLEGGAAPKVSANTSVPNTNVPYALDAPSAVLNNGGGAPAAATIHVNAYTGVYDGNAHSATGTATGVNGEDLSSLLNLGASFTNVPGGAAHWTFAGNANYLPASGDVSITITNATPTIHVTGYTGVYDGNPHGATGTATGVNGEDLSSLLNLGASFTSVPGGTAHWTFAGNANYAPANSDVAITIARATPVVTWNNPADITYGTALGATQLNATASVAGSLLYSPSSGTLLSAGMNQPLLASFTPTDATNYNSANKTVQINVLKGSSSIQVNGYTGVYDGNAHGATGTATGVNGEDLSSLLNLGASFTTVPGGTAHWTFPGNANYAGASGDVAIAISKATPAITWGNPAGIVYGTPLGATQLNAVASVAGSLLYSPSSGTLLSAGMNQPLLASFTPTDATNYNSASKTVQINVLKATASFSNLTSPLIAFGTSTVNLAGKISLGSFIPTGSVAITLNGVTQTSAIQADGTFSSNSATTSLTPATPPYSIAYSYGGDGNFNPATGSGTLTVVYNIVPLFDQSQSHQSGSTIPIKLEVSNAIGSNLSASNLIVAAVGVSLISTTAYGPVVDSGNANPDSNFRFDSNIYIFNLKTTGLGTGVYNLYFRVGADPTLHTVQFQIQ